MAASDVLIIGTHDGAFHCDDALACFMLKKVPRFRNAKIVRSRNPEVWKTCTVLADVGGVYDHKIMRYDHHQRSFSETYNSLVPSKPWVTKLSSAGLIYIHFGKDVVRIILEESDSKITEELVEIIYDKVYEDFIEEIDGIDNGVAQFDGEPRYRLTTTISQRVGYLNPYWNDPSGHTMERFEKAMALVGGEFVERIQQFQQAWLPARQLMVESIADRFNVDPSGEIIELKSGGIPWKDHIPDLEKSLKVEVPLKYGLYEDHTGKWRLQTVPIRPDSFVSRLPLPEAWRGLLDEKLTEATGIEGCVFAHINGFICVNLTREGALKMGRESLRIGKENAEK